jgi:hypothetical protein
VDLLKAAGLLIAVALGAGCVAWLVGQLTDDGEHARRLRCEALHGAYIDGYCLDVRQIPLEGGRR